MILCLSHSRDFYTIDIVQKRLRELNHDSCRLDSDLFSEALRFGYGGQGAPFSFKIDAPGQSFSNTDVQAVWYRKLWGITAPADLDPAYHAIYYQEYGTMRDLFLESMEHAVWINPVKQDHAIAGNKARQLELAARNGLDIVPTLFSNDPEKVRSFFYESCGGAMVAKLHGTLSRSMRGNTPSFPTTLVGEEALQQLDSLPYCPMIFQQYVPALYELRVAYIDGICFAGKIDTASSGRSRTDWRFATDVHAPWKPYTLPEKTIQSLDAMMKEMRLLFGAIDLIRHRDGRYIFLEVNPQGEWGMLQRDLGYPIGETIAERLVAGL